MKIDAVVDCVRYGIPKESVSTVRGTLKQIAKFGQEQGFLFGKGELKENFDEQNLFGKIGMIMTAPFSAVVMAGLAGVSAIKYMTTMAKTPKCQAFLESKGVSKEQMESWSSLSDTDVRYKLYGTGVWDGMSDRVNGGNVPSGRGR